MRPDKPREPLAGPDGGPESPFPLKIDGKVVSGFGRGSRELGIPTANIPIEGLSVGGHSDLESGVYYGWAGLSSDHKSSATKTDKEQGKAAVYPMVMSIGWNPFYKNEVRSVEVHIMHDFGHDFYGSHMNLIILGYIRPEYDYTTVESLIDDIRTDIQVAKDSLARPAYSEYKNDPSLLTFEGKSDVGH